LRNPWFHIQIHNLQESLNLAVCFTFEMVLQYSCFTAFANESI
jgi:hypothetical protein